MNAWIGDALPVLAGAITGLIGCDLVYRVLKKRRSTSQTQLLPGPSSSLNLSRINFPAYYRSQQSQPAPSLPSPSQPDPVPARRYIYGFRAWIPRWEESAPYWDVMGKTIIDIRNTRLMPVAGTGGDWQPGVNLARCNITGTYSGMSGDMALGKLAHLAPQEGCQCGFWMLDKLEDAIRRGLGIVTNWGDGVGRGDGGVVGSIVAWGKLIRHGAGVNQYETGWRAEKVQVVAFLDPDIQITESNIISAMHGSLRKKAFVLKALSERYDVPILNRVEIEEFTRSYAEEMWRKDA